MSFVILLQRGKPCINWVVVFSRRAHTRRNTLFLPAIFLQRKRVDGGQRHLVFIKADPSRREGMAKVQTCRFPDGGKDKLAAGFQNTKYFAEREWGDVRLNFARDPDRGIYRRGRAREVDQGTIFEPANGALIWL